MKTSQIWGWVMFYMITLFCEQLLEGGTIFSNSVTNASGTLTQPTIAESSNIFTASWAVISTIAFYLKALIPIFWFWAPTVYSGYMLWAWWIVAFSGSVAFIFGLIGIVRGVHSS